MKLLNCRACQDIVKLLEHERSCQCGRSRGRYVTTAHAVISGPARVLGIKSLDYHRAQPGVEYPWWFLEDDAARVTRLDDE